ncbi:hypothetical protein FACS1894172_06300 [Spirochaetia bacterium]|nr:hypothetical protein FACS1894172_06300 [Spirochaetia bacterium]
MAKYLGIQKEETLKGLVYKDYFSDFGYEPNIDNIDFVITDIKIRNELFSDGVGSSKHYLWAEAKKGTHDVFDMFTHLILTCKKTYEKGEHLAPPWLGCFDEARIAFVSFHDMLPIFNETDFNWNTTPSNHETPDFQKARGKIAKLIGAKIAVYNFGSDDKEIKEFIKTHFVSGAAASIKSPITKDNFVQIFIKWIKEVKPFINISKEEWTEFKKKGILDCDFYRADLMSLDGNTITEKLKIILKNDNYKFQAVFDGRLFASDIDFTDDGTAYKRFWNKYGRPPAQVYQHYIIDRRDLLVPQNIREVKGSFFTPKIWADKSKECLAAVFGEQWQDEYYIWDCAAGTGNLLAGLTNEYNVWASDIDEGNIETMQSLIDIDENLNLLSGHIFQFDFLNDSFDKLPVELKKILGDPEERKKLIIYINPPYAEASSIKMTSNTKENKSKIATETKVHNDFISVVGAATRELFVQFFLRIYHEIPFAKLATFSKLKYITAANFSKFREFFKAKYKGGFICKANTFDNVDGKFPIGFLIWDLENKESIRNVNTDIFISDSPVTHSWKNGEKSFYVTPKGSYIIDWLRQYYDKMEKADMIGYIRLLGTDMQSNRSIFITSKLSLNDIKENLYTNITKKNIIEVCIYLAVRHCAESTWLNDRDQFLWPNEDYNNDEEFKNNCLVYALFDNNIQSQYGVNHWIPFTEKEVRAKEKFDSDFMSGFLKGRIFSPEAQALLDAGLELWKYYHATIKNNKTVSINASFYDIREFFQGRNEKGIMKTKSTDETYNQLLGLLRDVLKIVTQKIQPKVYQYGFLKD